MISSTISVDFESYFDKVRIKEQLDESAETLLEEYVAAIADKIREELGIPEVLRLLLSSFDNTLV